MLQNMPWDCRIFGYTQSVNVVVCSTDVNRSSVVGGGGVGGGGGGGTAAAIYRCRLCPYRSDKVTVVRHHVMAHLLYHPYRCPYCDDARSVKSSPITKHVRLRHPGQQPNFFCQRDEQLERFVRRTLFIIAG